MTGAELDELERLCAAVPVLDVRTCWQTGGEYVYADGAKLKLLLAARQAVPRLVARVRELESALFRADELLGAYLNGATRINTGRGP